MNSDINSPSSFGSGMEDQRSDMSGSGMGGSGMGGVRGMASQAGEKLMDTAEQQKMAGADFVTSLADATRRAAGEFEDQVPQAAEYIRYAADQMQTMSDSLRRRDVGRMLSDVQSFARRQPTAFLGVSFLAGFAAIRFLRSSSGSMSNGGSSSYGRGRMSGGESGGMGGGSWQDREQPDSGRYGSTSSGMSSSGSLSPGSDM